MKHTIRFENPYQIGPFRDAIDMIFPYSVVNSDLIGAPEETSSTRRFNLKVGISRTLAACWNLQPGDLIKVLFEYGKRYVVQRLKDNTLTAEQELWLTTQNYPTNCPFDPGRIPAPSGATIEVDTGSDLATRIVASTVAASIIESRDNINALYHHKYGEKLIVLREERDLLQFFQECNSAEELSYRISSLRNAAANLSVDSLRRVTAITDPQVQSISLLEAYLTQISGFRTEVIRPLKELNKLRQGYPIHGDRVTGVIDALAYFGIPYPVTDYSLAWRALLENYGRALRDILDLVRKDVFPDGT